MNRLQNKVAIVTGGASGIGRVTAKLFLEEGAKVMLVDWKEETLKKTAKALSSPHLSYCVADVSNTKDIKRYIEKTLNTFGKIDIFFSNAGIEGTVAPIVDYPEETFDQVIKVNLKGVWLGCKYVIPKMSEHGSVIITSSVAGLKGFAGLSAYVASKHGTVGIMRVAALEFAEKKIRVNAVHPGPVETEMMRRIEAEISPANAMEAKQGFEGSVPFGRYAKSEEIAALTLFLASEESRYITGCTYVIDGGMIVG